MVGELLLHACDVRELFAERVAISVVLLGDAAAGDGDGTGVPYTDTVVDLRAVLGLCIGTVLLGGGGT